MRSTGPLLVHRNYHRGMGGSLKQELETVDRMMMIPLPRVERGGEGGRELLDIFNHARFFTFMAAVIPVFPAMSVRLPLCCHGYVTQSPDDPSSIDVRNGSKQLLTCVNDARI